MCDPFSIALAVAGSAASAVGQSIQNREMQANQVRQMQNQRNVTDARNRELDESRARQKKFSEANEQTLQKTLKKFEPDQQAASQQQAQQQSTEQFQKTVSPAESAYRPSGDAPAIVSNTYDTVTKDANTRGTANAARLGALDGYKTNLLGNNIALKDAGAKIDMQNGFSQSEAALLPHYQDFAQAQVDRPNGGAKPLSGIGPALKGIGTLAATAGGANLGGSSGQSLGNWFSSLKPLPDTWVY